MKTRQILSAFAVGVMLVLSLASVTFSSTLLFSENFSGFPNGSQAPGWFPYGNINIQNGQYVIPCVAKGCVPPVSNGVWTSALYQAETFGDMNYSVRATGLGPCSPPSADLPQLPPVLAIVFRAQPSKNPSLNTYYAWMDIDKLQISKYVGGQPVVLGGITLATLAKQGLLLPNDTTTVMNSAGVKSVTFNPYGTYYLEISAYGSTLSMYFKGHLEVQVNDGTYSSGYIGFGTYACNGAFNDVLVTQGHGPLTTSSSASSLSSTTATARSTSATTTSATDSTSTSSETSSTSLTTTTASTTSTTSTTISTLVTETCVVVFSGTALNSTFQYATDCVPA